MKRIERKLLAISRKLQGFTVDIQNSKNKF
jgi:hypothetical protein